MNADQADTLAADLEVLGGRLDAIRREAGLAPPASTSRVQDGEPRNIRGHAVLHGPPAAPAYGSTEPTSPRAGGTAPLTATTTSGQGRLVRAARFAAGLIWGIAWRLAAAAAVAVVAVFLAAAILIGVGTAVLYLTQ